MSGEKSWDSTLSYTDYILQKIVQRRPAPIEPGTLLNTWASIRPYAGSLRASVRNHAHVPSAPDLDASRPKALTTARATYLLLTFRIAPRAYGGPVRNWTQHRISASRSEGEFSREEAEGLGMVVVVMVGRRQERLLQSASRTPGFYTRSNPRP